MITIMRCLVLGSLFFCCNVAAEEIPENASCVVERYREYTETVVSLYEETKIQLQKHHPVEFDLLEYCLEMVILDAKYQQGIVDRLWEEEPDRLFMFSKRLSEIGSHYDRSEVLKNEIKICSASRSVVGSSMWGDVISTQWGVQRDITPLFERFVYLEQLQWPDIECDS